MMSTKKVLCLALLGIGAVPASVTSPSELPPGWASAEKYGITYYCNIETGGITFTEPGAAARHLDKGGKTKGFTDYGEAPVFDAAAQEGASKLQLETVILLGKQVQGKYLEEHSTKEKIEQEKLKTGRKCSLNCPSCRYQAPKQKASLIESGYDIKHPLFLVRLVSYIGEEEKEAPLLPFYATRLLTAGHLVEVVAACVEMLSKLSDEDKRSFLRNWLFRRSPYWHEVCNVGLEQFGIVLGSHSQDHLMIINECANSEYTVLKPRGLAWQILGKITAITKSCKYNTSTVVHELGHMAQYFMFNDEQRQKFKTLWDELYDFLGGKKRAREWNATLCNDE